MRRNRHARIELGNTKVTDIEKVPLRSNLERWWTTFDPESAAVRHLRV